MCVIGVTSSLEQQPPTRSLHRAETTTRPVNPREKLADSAEPPALPSPHHPIAFLPTLPTMVSLPGSVGWST